MLDTGSNNQRQDYCVNGKIDNVEGHRANYQSYEQGQLQNATVESDSRLNTGTA
jgi:hypothetical protein